MPMSFERQPRETSKAFAAFQEYLAMGPERSLSAVGAKLGKSKVMMEKWSRKYDWPARVAAHGAHLALVEREAAEAVVRAKGADWAERYAELRESEWRARLELVDLAWEIVRRWRARPDRCGSLEGLARLLDLMSTLGRRACEVATDRKEVVGRVEGSLRIEIETALDKIYGKPIPGEVVDVEAAPVVPALAGGKP
ncbi:MAG TPA: hypothetical protein PKI20_08680 [Verrucomicrobiota bacterium]|jgi:hypothetical protein|nr:hypothetical protein [Verrucomicrobiota bacterium]HQL78180.1 hypothetical protein [Verrucomicrobiota bacterium]